MANLRRLGTELVINPTITGISIQPSDFNVVGVMGDFERRFATAKLVRSKSEFEETFGYGNPAYFGNDVVGGFFDNLRGVDGKAYVKSYVGNSSDVIDATTASTVINDAGGTAVMTVQAAHEGDQEYGVSGNNTAVQFTLAARVSASVSTATQSTDTSIVVNSVIGFVVGDVIRITGVSGSPSAIYRKITAITPASNTITFNTAVGDIYTVNSEVISVGYSLRIYRRLRNGNVTQVEDSLTSGRVFSLESEVESDYIVNALEDSKYIRITNFTARTSLADSALENSFFATQTSSVFLTGGSDGTGHTASSWALDLQSFNSLPVRILLNAEEQDAVFNADAIDYCVNREDTPMFLCNVPSQSSRSYYVNLGRSLQSNAFTTGVMIAKHAQVNNIYSDAGLPRTVPPIGHIAGAWVRCIYTLGMHYIPATRAVPLYGILGIVGNQFSDDSDRTELAEAGVNVIQNYNGQFQLRNMFTLSTQRNYRFANGLILSNFVGVSVKNSLSDYENYPNTLGNIKDRITIVRTFLLNLWRRGNTGNVPVGEFFGGDVDATFENYVTIEQAVISNTQTSIGRGEANINYTISYPTPLGSLRIGRSISI